MNWFVMSRRFNKTNPEDFGFIIVDGMIISPIDQSVWKPKNLYDFGWGQENGYYKTPLPEFSELMRIILEESDEDDIYGSAAIIIEMFPEELLLYLESIETLTRDIKEKLNKVFVLFKPINRTFKNQMSLEEVKSEYERWLKISKKFQYLNLRN